ncbi:MAG: glycosyltransferase, partial [Chloroflexi bacterium CFX6]|nr:glycosyltransferase [Chloroflexi bacterium CFX6]
MSSPDILIEVSWEVCNMVGGIHTVLATKVRAMQARYGTRYIVVGPDLARAEGTRPVFREEIWHAGLHEALADAPVGCRMGRWLVPGEPRCLLVDHNALLAHKDAILAQYWEWYRLDSIAGGWDYLEPVMFSHAVGQAVERLASAYFLPRQLAVVVQSHEWLTGATLLYLKRRVPEVGTVFTTHATTLGRALAANRPSPELYDTMGAVDPDATARELGVPSKHSMESIAAREADCFTTVSAITAEECLHFLRRAPDPILMNGMDDDFPPALLREPTAVHAARARLFEIATLATATTYDRDQTELFVCAGRYEFVNKGIDVALDALAALDHDLRTRSGGRVVVFALFPAGNAGPRRAILQASRTGERVEQPYLSTHDLHHEASDPILRRLADEGLLNRPENAVHVVFVPVYLDGNDPLVHETYYELVVGADLTLFPSFYEPWGYTPMESIALGVPTITTDLAGFGRWARDRGDWPATGVAVVARQGRAFEWVSQSLMEHLVAFLGLSPDERRALA